MESSTSPRAVMRLAYRVALRHLPAYPSRFSRRDRATQPQLFACLVLRQFYNLSYRRAETLLRDCPDLRRAIRMRNTPDHNTLCDAFERLARQDVFAQMLDTLVAAFDRAGLLALDAKPAAVDSSCYESHHFSRHFERRKRESSAESERSATVRGLPKLAICVACACHVVLSFWAGTGMGSDRPHLAHARLSRVASGAGDDAGRRQRVRRRGEPRVVEGRPERRVDHPGDDRASDGQGADGTLPSADGRVL